MCRQRDLDACCPGDVTPLALEDTGHDAGCFTGERPRDSERDPCLSGSNRLRQETASITPYGEEGVAECTHLPLS
jgi:hypothetical protein